MGVCKMRFIRLSLNLILISMLLNACVTEFESKQQVFQTANPTVEDILTEDNDIFLWDSTVYLTDIEWVNELILTENKLLGTITHSSTDASAFINGTANKLSIGSEIYSTNERGDILIVKSGNSSKYYLKLVEG